VSAHSEPKTTANPRDHQSLVTPPGVAAGSSALPHLRVCDLSGQLAGAGATRFLAAFGAQVIRVEDPSNQGRWDILRGAAPHIDSRRGNELGGAFNNHNVEKLGITLNLRTTEGKRLLEELVKISDVVTENFSAGVMARLGFDYERLRSLNPRVVYVSNSGFGKSGPYARYKTFGPIVQACCGLTFAARTGRTAARRLGIFLYGSHGRELHGPGHPGCTG
jgi:benzylsuccinate CoA-transferase BbsF subunit